MRDVQSAGNRVVCDLLTRLLVSQMFLVFHNKKLFNRRFVSYLPLFFVNTYTPIILWHCKYKLHCKPHLVNNLAQKVKDNVDKNLVIKSPNK